jgi:hypothetical protein
MVLAWETVSRTLIAFCFVVNSEDNIDLRFGSVLVSRMENVELISWGSVFLR